MIEPLIRAHLSHADPAVRLQRQNDLFALVRQGAPNDYAGLELGVMRDLTEPEAAWLAGLWDGEGSVGVSRSYATGRLCIITQIQINMTHEPTLARVVELFHAMGFKATHYQTTRKASHHKDAYLVALRRTEWVRKTALALAPYSVTKRAQWDLMIELCNERVARRGLSASGWLNRGGRREVIKDTYSPRELEIAAELAAINARPVKEITSAVAQ